MAILFNGTNSSILSGDIDVVGSITISAWIKTSSATDQIIVDKNTGGGAPCNYMFRFTATGYLLFGFYNEGWITKTDTQKIVNDGIWHHVLVKYDQANVYFYVDGLAKDSFALTTAILADNNNVTIGSLGTYTVYPFNGSISEVAIWNDGLSVAQIVQLATSRLKYTPLQIPAPPSYLKAYWPLDDFADGATASGANTIIDRSGNGKHGTPTNSPVGRAESVLSYPAWPQIIVPEAAAVGTVVKDIIQPGIIAFPR